MTEQECKSEFSKRTFELTTVPPTPTVFGMVMGQDYSATKKSVPLFDEADSAHYCKEYPSQVIHRQLLCLDEMPEMFKKTIDFQNEDYSWLEIRKMIFKFPIAREACSSLTFLSQYEHYKNLGKCVENFMETKDDSDSIPKILDDCSIQLIQDQSL